MILREQVPWPNFGFAYMFRWLAAANLDMDKAVSYGSTTCSSTTITTITIATTSTIFLDFQRRAYHHHHLFLRSLWYEYHHCRLQL
jgi:hypothetical protein